MCTRIGFKRTRAGLIAAGLLVTTVLARADDAASTPASATPSAEAANDIARLLPQLDDAEFSQRQAASQELMEAGKTVFPQLEKAALEGSREASGRAIDILKTHFTRGDDDTKQAAQAALERLSKSGSAGPAQRASEALNPPKPPEIPINGAFGAVPIFRNGNIQIQVAAGNINGARRVSTRRDANGKVEIEATENNSRKIKIVKQPNGSIEIEITETQNGKETTKKVEAKDVDELKKKDAEAAKIYEQYNQNGIGNIQLQAGGIQLGGIQRAGAPQPPKEIVERMMKSLDDTIEQLKPQAANNPAVQQQIESLKVRRKTYEQMLPPAEPAKPAEPATPAKEPAEKPADAPAEVPANK